MKDFLEDARRASFYLGLYEEYMKYTLKLIKIYKEVADDLTGYHRSLGVQYHQLAVNYLMLPIGLPLAVRFTEAQKYLEKAVKILPITHGDDHPLMKDVRTHLDHCALYKKQQNT
ncbi:uncharacterized protein [Amphiura filiformis]|uniref:uncharacterized protein n=1 Tax=Amphiura filiformis TaxID=82378 RepID=UPI003B21E749